MYPEMICTTINFILMVFLIAAWMGMLEKVKNADEKADEVAKRHNALLQGLRDAGVEIEFYEGEVKIHGKKSSGDEDANVVAAVVVTPPTFG